MSCTWQRGEGQCSFPWRGQWGPMGVRFGIDFAPTMVTETAKELAARRVANPRCNRWMQNILGFHTLCR